MAINGCAECLNKQRVIDRLTEANQRLKQPRRYQQRHAQEGFFGGSPPSSKLPVTPNTKPAKEAKRQGARPGHPGAGRQACAARAAERVVDIPAEVGDRGPACAGPLEDQGDDDRLVLESRPVQAERILSRLSKQDGPRCPLTFQPRAPAVWPKSLYGNPLLATAATRPDLQGIPLGRVCEQTGMGPGSLVAMFHRLARRWAGVPTRLLAAYRQAPVKQADETGWRTNGPKGYPWLFATPQLSLFLCRQPRAASLPKDVFGNVRRPGWLVVDRDGGYNKAPCAIQSCYSHLWREVQDREQEFPEATEVIAFVSTVAPRLSLAMGLRSRAIADAECYSQAAVLKAQIIVAMDQPAQHLGIRHIQEIFRAPADRLYHWAADRRGPAANTLAERDRRPTVMARTVSFGSQSDAGAHTRGILLFHPAHSAEAADRRRQPPQSGAGPPGPGSPSRSVPPVLPQWPHLRLKDYGGRRCPGLGTSRLREIS